MSLPAEWSGASKSNQDPPATRQQQQLHGPLYAPMSTSAYMPSIDSTKQAPLLRPLQPQPYLQPMPLAPPTYPPGESPYPQHHQPILPGQPPSQPSLLLRPSHLRPRDWREDHQDIKRLRISRACDGCRRKKIKCDTTGPDQTCKNCQASKIDCTYNDSAKKRGPPKGYIEVLENRLKRMERILGGLAEDNGDQPAESDGQSPPASSPERVKDGMSAETSGSMNTPSNNSSSTAVSGTNNAGRISGLSSLSSSTSTRYIGDMSPLPFLAQKINFEDARVESHIGFKVRKFGDSLVMYKEDEDEQDASVRLLSQLGFLKPGETINTLNDWIYKVAGIDKATSDRLMKIYFAYIHPGLPIVNKVLFLKQYRRELGDYPAAPLLNAMYGSAARYIENCKIFGDKVLPDDTEDWDNKEGWSESLFDNLLAHVRGRYSPCVATIQALVLGQYHRASLDEKMASGWLLNSAATRMAQDLGLHRSSESWDIPESDKETRRRVWWSVYILDKWSAAATGRPQTIFDEDCDEIYPSESATIEEVMDIPTSDADDDVVRYPSLDTKIAQKVKGDKIPLYQPFVQLVKLSEILGRILQGLYTPRAKRHSAEHGSDAIVTYLDNTLSEWRSNLPPSLQISSNNVRRLDSRGQSPLLSMSGMMYLTYCTLLILLHRPFIEKEEDGTRLSMSSLSICTNAATRCVDIAEKMHYRDFLLVSWSFAMYPVFTASLIHIYNAGSADTIVADVAKSNLIRAIGVVRRLGKLSPGALRMHEVLTKLMATRNITVDEASGSDDDDVADDTKLKRRRRTKSSASARNQPRPAAAAAAAAAASPVPSPLQAAATTMQSSLTATSSVSSQQPYASPTGALSSGIKAGMSPRTSDVGRGGGGGGGDHIRVSSGGRSSSDQEKPSSGGSTPSSFINGEWINGLCSSIDHPSLPTQEMQGKKTRRIANALFRYRQRAKWLVAYNLLYDQERLRLEHRKVTCIHFANLVYLWDICSLP
ncbi:fungal-specific transcription factor domain-containing protein [Dichotomocladium elegans]|nr:fungal-specific transcription factor domain-containing protein [Dichotomocladium elegans]